MRSAICQLFSAPGDTANWGVSEWGDTLPRLIQSGLAGAAAVRLEECGVPISALPPAVQRQLAAMQIASDAEVRSLRWELGEVTRALRGSGIKAVPLKGADYVLRGVRPGRGRKVADLDLLVRKADLTEAVALLRAAGWGDSEHDPSKNDDHHLPMMIHTRRATHLELHFQLVAEGGAVSFDVDSVIDAAVLQPDGGLALLQPEDCVLVCVAHFIRNSRPFSAFRDLIDLRELVSEFSASRPDFGTALVVRAEAVGLGAALSRAVRDATDLFGEVSSAELAKWSRRRRPSLAGGSALVLVPDGHKRPTFATRLGRVGRMFARIRSAYPASKTLRAGSDVLFGSGD